jgi:L-aminopeptidase/D-esterase-like protein
MITEVPGIRVGHWTGEGTGVSVVLAPSGTVGAADVRGGAPATREGALLLSGSLVERLDAVVLTGGSAFGLASADGVMGFLAERGQGFPTRAGAVPIVGAAAIFDLVESGGFAPGAAEGRLAAEAAERGDPPVRGRVGAGRGASVGKWRGPEHGVPGGLGGAARRDGDLVVGAVAVVNASGDVIGPDGAILAGSSAARDVEPFPEAPGTSAPDASAPETNPFEQTTLVVVATNGRLSKLQCRLVAESAHDGMARALHPAHTRFDGDIAFALATGEVDANPDRLRVTATDVVADAIRDAVAP